MEAKARKPPWPTIIATMLFLLPYLVCVAVLFTVFLVAAKVRRLLAWCRA